MFTSAQQPNNRNCSLYFLVLEYYLISVKFIRSQFIATIKIELPISESKHVASMTSAASQNKQIILPSQQLESKMDIQNLMKMLPMKNCQSILKDFQNTLNILKDVKTHPWQKRTKSIENIKLSFFLIADYVQNQEDLVKHFKSICPEVFNQVEDGANGANQNAYSKSQVGHSASKNIMKSPSQRSCVYNDKCADQSQQAQKPRDIVKYHVVSCMMRCVWPSLIKQLSDLRTSVAKEACNLIVWLSMEYPKEFTHLSYKVSQQQSDNLQSQQAGPTVLGGANGVRVFKEDALPKLITSGNKHLQDLGHQSMQEIIGHCPPIQNVMVHLASLINSKNNLLRLRIAQYFEMILSQAVNPKNGTVNQARAGTKETVEQNSQIIDFFLIRATDDQMQEVRNYARFCFLQYRKLLPEQSTVLLMVGIEKVHVRKQIIQEFGLDQSKLNQELQNIESVQRGQEQFQYETRYAASRVDTQEDSYISQVYTASRQKQRTPLREAVIKKMHRFEGAKTPEQFLRAMRNLKSPQQQRAACSRSPLVPRQQTKMTSICRSHVYQNDAYGGQSSQHNEGSVGMASRHQSPIGLRMHQRGYKSGKTSERQMGDARNQGRAATDNTDNSQKKQSIDVYEKRIFSSKHNNREDTSAVRPPRLRMTRNQSKSQISSNGSYHKTLSRNYQCNVEKPKAPSHQKFDDSVKRIAFKVKRDNDCNEVVDKFNVGSSSRDHSQDDRMNNQMRFMNKFRHSITPLNCQSVLTNNEGSLAGTKSQPRLLTTETTKKVKTEVQTPNMMLSHSRSNSASQVQQAIIVSSRYQTLKKRYSEGKRDESAKAHSTERPLVKAPSGTGTKFNMDDSIVVSQGACSQAPNQRKFKVQPAFQSKEQLIVNLTGLKNFNDKSAKSSRIPQIPSNTTSSKQVAAKHIKVDLGIERKQESYSKPLYPTLSALQEQSLQPQNEAKQTSKRKYHAYFDVYKSNTNQLSSSDIGNKTPTNTMHQGTLGTAISSVNDPYELMDDKSANNADPQNKNENENVSMLHQNSTQFDSFSKKSAKNHEGGGCYSNNQSTNNLEKEFKHFIQQENLSIKSKEFNDSNKQANVEVNGWKQPGSDQQPGEYRQGAGRTQPNKPRTSRVYHYRMQKAESAIKEPPSQDSEPEFPRKEMQNYPAKRASISNVPTGPAIVEPKRTETKLNSHRILMRRQQCRSPQIIHCKSRAQEIVSKVEQREEQAPRHVEANGSPQPAHSHRNLHDRHNSKIGKGVFQQKKCSALPCTTSAALQPSETNQQILISNKSEVHRQAETQYNSRVSLQSNSIGYCAPAPTFVHAGHGVAHKGISQSSMSTYKSQDNQGRLSNIKVYSKKAHRQDSVDGSSSVKKEKRVARAFEQYPRPLDVSPKPITSSPRMFDFKYNDEEDKAPNPLSLNSKQFERSQVSPVSPVRAFDKGHEEIEYGSELKRDPKNSEGKAGSVIIDYGNDAQIPFSHAPTPKPQDQLPTPFSSTDLMSISLPEPQSIHENMRPSLNPNQNRPSQLVQQEDENQKIQIQPDVLPRERQESNGKNQNFTNIRRQSALLHDRYAYRSRRNQQSQLAKMANNSYEPYSDSMHDGKQFVSQRSISTFRSGEGIDAKPSPAVRPSLLHRPRHHDSSIGSHYKDRAKRVKQLEVDLNGEISFKNTQMHEESRQSEVRHDDEQPTLQTPAPPALIHQSNDSSQSMQIVCHRRLKNARKSDNVPSQYAAQQQQVLNTSNRQEKDSKLQDCIASLKQFKIDESQNSSGYQKAKKEAERLASMDADRSDIVEQPAYGLEPQDRREIVDSQTFEHQNGVGKVGHHRRADTGAKNERKSRKERAQRKAPAQRVAAAANIMDLTNMPSFQEDASNHFFEAAKSPIEDDGVNNNVSLDIQACEENADRQRQIASYQQTPTQIVYPRTRSRKEIEATPKLDFRGNIDREQPDMD